MRSVAHLLCLATLIFEIWLLPANAAICGINSNFVDIRVDLIGACTPANPSATINGEGLLTRLKNPETRTRVEAHLHAMREAGSSGLRAIVWFGEARGVLPSNLFSSTDADAAAEAVQTYFGLASDAGFKSLVLSFSPQALSNPGCREHEWGDCFDPATITRSATFVATVAQRVQRKFPWVLIDLQNEGCTTATQGSVLLRNNAIYQDAVAAAVAAALPRDAAVTLSSILARGPACVEAALAVLERYGLAHGDVDVHVGDLQAAALLPKVVELARQRGRQVLIGEIHLADAVGLHQAVQQVLKGEAGAGISGVFFWPDSGSGNQCAVTIRPPYQPPRGFSCAAP